MCVYVERESMHVNTYYSVGGSSIEKNQRQYVLCVSMHVHV